MRWEWRNGGIKFLVGENGGNPEKNLPRPNFVHHETYMEWPRRELGIQAVGGEGLTHGCARVAHCFTARWRNLSHYCRPLRQYDVWFTCSDNREAPTAEPKAHSVQKQAFRVHHWTSKEASLRHSSGWGTEAFPLSSVICALVV